MGKKVEKLGLGELSKQVQLFRDERDWKQFHSMKDMLLALYLEAGELAELIQWKTEAEIKDYLNENKTAFADELSDLLYWVLLIARDSEIDLEQAFVEKMKKNSEKYPVDLVKGKSHKYTHYENRPGKG